MAVLASTAQEHGLDQEDVKSYVHIIFGLSKDWCASGLRVGCLWTLNARLQAALQNVNAFYGVSGIAQHMIAEMLEDLSFVDKYLKENKRRLASAYDTLAGWVLQLANLHSRKLRCDHLVWALTLTLAIFPALVTPKIATRHAVVHS